MARRLGWSDVRGGLIATAAIIGISALVLKYARVGVIRGDTIRLYAVVAEARGILKGSEVWLSGQKIGQVSDIQFRSPHIADTTERLILELELMERYGAALRKDARAEIRSGGSVIGAVVVYLGPGTTAAPVVANGDTLRARSLTDVEGATAQFAAVARELPAILKDVRTIRAQAAAADGTVGAVLKEGMPGGGAMAQTRSHLATLQARLGGGRGTLGQVMNGGLGTRAQRVIARADSVRTLLASPGTSLGRFRRDSTLVREVADIRNELSIVRALLAEPRGTAGRVLHDSALTDALGSVHTEMGLLLADLRKHPLRYISF